MFASTTKMVFVAMQAPEVVGSEKVAPPLKTQPKEAYMCPVVNSGFHLSYCQRYRLQFGPLSSPFYPKQNICSR
jgi:hypothetical protein